MKHFNFKKVLLLLALVALVENGAVITSNAAETGNSYSEDGGIAPCSDMPALDENYD